MPAHLLADAVLFLHLLIALFLVAGLVLIPMGGINKWRWVRHRRLRLIHAALMVFVALEALLGIACPLTILEAALRREEAPAYFLAALMQSLLFWDAPLAFFLALYLVCAAWVLVLWRVVPPNNHSAR